MIANVDKIITTKRKLTRNSDFHLSGQGFDPS
jgi:hypothetical protein